MALSVPAVILALLGGGQGPQSRVASNRARPAGAGRVTLCSRRGVDPMPGKQVMPDTLKRSPSKAQRTWVKAHDSAVQTYGEGRRAHMTAIAALKHSFQKVGDHWEPKDGKGPSDPRAARGRRRGGGRSYGGVDVLGSSKAELMNRARNLGVKGRSSMSKEQLADAIARQQ
jgi:hypothetical protein